MTGTSRRSWHTWLVPWVLAGTLAWAYRHSAGIPLLLDDHRTIRDNASLRHLSDLGRVLMPNSRVFTAGRPLLNLSFALNFAWTGPHLASYHAANLAIHLLASWMLFALLRRFWSDGLAAAAALLWALHPVQTESVAYLSQRAESLMGLAYLATLYAYARATEGPCVHRGWAAVSVAACLAGMLTKETMVTAPAIAFLFDRCLISGTWREAWRRHRGLLLCLAATWLGLAALMVSSRLVARGVGFRSGATALSYLQAEGQAIALYQKLAVWPHPLVFDYGPHFGAEASTAAVAGGAAWALATLAAAILFWVRRPREGFWAVWFFALLLPTSSFVPIAGQPMAESRLYLPLAGVIVLFVLALWRLSRPVRISVVAALAAAACVTTAARINDYRDAASLWALTAQQRPDNPRAQTELANYEQALPDGSERALAHYRRALALDPKAHDTQNDLGALLFRLNRIGEAAPQLQAAVASDPADAASHYNWGRVLAAQQDLAGAEAQYRAALAIQPDYPEVHNSLAALAADRPNGLAEAIAELETALRQRPGDPMIENNLGMLWYRQREGLAAAEAHFRAAVRGDPRLAAAHYNLANTLLREGHRSAAISEYRTALSVQPNYAEAHCNLAIALAGDPATRTEAQREAEAALQLNPTLAPAAALLRSVAKP